MATGPFARNTRLVGTAKVSRNVMEEGVCVGMAGMASARPQGNWRSKKKSTMLSIRMPAHGSSECAFVSCIVHKLKFYN